MMRKFLVQTAVAVAALAGLGTAAHAAPIGLSITIFDMSSSTSLLCDTRAVQTGSNCFGFTPYALGATSVSFAQSVPINFGNFQFDNSSFNANQNSATLVAQLASNNLNLQANVANSGLRITTTAFGFTSPVGRFKSLRGSASQNDYDSGLDGSNQSYGFFVDGTDSGSVATGATCASSPLLVSGGGCAATGLFDIGAPGTQSFSLTTVQRLFVVAPGDVFQNSSRVQVTVPEPASLALVGLALVGAGFAARRSKA